MSTKDVVILPQPPVKTSEESSPVKKVHTYDVVDNSQITLSDLDKPADNKTLYPQGLNHFAHVNKMEKPAGGILCFYTQIIDDLFNIIKEIHTNPRGNVNTIHHQNPLQSAVSFGIISPQSQKTTASREKLNILHMAHNTPKACFFMRNNRTPKENAVFILHTENLIFLSMVERSGQPFAVGCLPYVAVSHPVTFYRPTVRSLAVVPKNQHMELSAMIYKFLCVNRTLSAFNLCVISLNATTEENARLCLSSDFRHIATIARINPKFHRTLNQHSPVVKIKDGTNWHHVNIHTLPKSQDVGMIQGTETIHGNRNREQCGIFLPQIPSNGSAPLAHTYHQTEFAVRATRGNKAHTRTNNAGYCMVAVEPLSHPTKGGKSYLSTRDHTTMKIYSQNHRTFADNPALSVSDVMGVNHA